MTVLRSRGQPSTNLRPHNRSCRLAASCGEQDLPRRQKAGETEDQQLKTVKPWEPAEIVRFRTCSTRRGSLSQARDLRPCERGVADSGGCSGPALQLPLSPLTPGWSREAENRAARKCKETPAEAPRRPGKVISRAPAIIRLCGSPPDEARRPCADLSKSASTAWARCLSAAQAKRTRQPDGSIRIHFLLPLKNFEKYRDFLIRIGKCCKKLYQILYWFRSTAKHDIYGLATMYCRLCHARLKRKHEISQARYLRPRNIEIAG
jgi:hypothetical protein